MRCIYKEWPAYCKKVTTDSELRSDRDTHHRNRRERPEGSVFDLLSNDQGEPLRSSGAALVSTVDQETVRTWMILNDRELRLVANTAEKINKAKIKDVQTTIVMSEDVPGTTEIVYCYPPTTPKDYRYRHLKVRTKTGCHSHETLLVPNQVIREGHASNEQAAEMVRRFGEWGTSDLIQKSIGRMTQIGVTGLITLPEFLSALNGTQYVPPACMCGGVSGANRGASTPGRPAIAARADADMDVNNAVPADTSIVPFTSGSPVAVHAAAVPVGARLRVSQGSQVRQRENNGMAVVVARGVVGVAGTNVGARRPGRASVAETNGATLALTDGNSTTAGSDAGSSVAGDHSKLHASLCLVVSGLGGLEG